MTDNEQKLEEVNNVVQLFADQSAVDATLDKDFPWIFVNDKQNPWPRRLLDMMYQGVGEESLGVMVAKHADTGEEATLLVGIMREGSNITVHALARMLNAEEAVQYLAPDGEGGYIDHRKSE